MLLEELTLFILALSIGTCNLTNFGLKSLFLSDKIIWEDHQSIREANSLVVFH